MQTKTVIALIIVILLIFGFSLYSIYTSINTNELEIKQDIPISKSASERIVHNKQKSKISKTPPIQDDLENTEPDQNKKEFETKTVETKENQTKPSIIELTEIEDADEEFLIKITDSIGRTIELANISIVDIFTHKETNIKLNPSGFFDYKAFRKIDQYFFIKIENRETETKLGFINFSKIGQLSISLEPLSTNQKFFPYNRSKYKHANIKSFYTDDFMKYSHLIEPPTDHPSDIFPFQQIYESMPDSVKVQNINKDLSKSFSTHSPTNEYSLSYKYSSSIFNTKLMAVDEVIEVKKALETPKIEIKYLVKDFFDDTVVNHGNIETIYSNQTSTSHPIDRYGQTKLKLNKYPLEHPYSNLNEYTSDIAGYQKEILELNLSKEPYELFILKRPNIKLHMKNIARYQLDDAITIIKNSESTILLQNKEGQIIQNLFTSGPNEVFTWSSDFKKLMLYSRFVAVPGQNLNLIYPKDLSSYPQETHKIQLIFNSKPIINQKVKIFEDGNQYSVKTDQSGTLHLYDLLSDKIRLEFQLQISPEQKQYTSITVNKNDFDLNVYEIRFDQVNFIFLNDLDDYSKEDRWELISKDETLKLSAKILSDKIRYYSHKKANGIFLIHQVNKKPFLVSTEVEIGSPAQTFHLNDSKAIISKPVSFKLTNLEEIQNGIVIVNPFYSDQIVKIVNNSFEAKLITNSYNKLKILSDNYCSKELITSTSTSANQPPELIELEKSNGVVITTLANQHWNIHLNFKPNDIIIKYNNNPINNVKDLRHLEKTMQSGDTINITIIRDNDIKEAQLPFTKFLNIKNTTSNNRR